MIGTDQIASPLHGGFPKEKVAEGELAAFLFEKQAQSAHHWTKLMSMVQRCD
eukprot:gene2166-28741_t